MKKYIIIFIISVFNFYACDDESERPALTVSEIDLLVPENGAAIDLNSRLNVTFAWEDAFIVDEYELLFSMQEDMSDAVSLDPRRTPHLIPIADMNDIASQLGISTGGKDRIFWTVRSRKTSQPTTTDVRMIDLTRLASQPLTPARNSKIELDFQSPDSEILFSWESVPDVQTYKLIISANSDLSNPLIEKDIVTTSATITHQQFQEIIESNANNLKRYKANTIYWNVEVNGKMLANSSWNLKMNGMKTFTDVRGSETITYLVSVINNGEEELVWMAENLRATKLVDGSDLVYEGQESWNSQYFPSAGAKSSASSYIPVPIQEHAGMYYRVKMIGNNSTTTEWINLLVPEGWKVPEESDFKKLVEAANKVSKHLEVLRHPEGFPNLMSGSRVLESDYMNQFNMNMVCNGINRISGTGSLYITEFAALDGAHMMYATNNTSQCFTLEVTNPGIGNTRPIAIGNNAPVAVRLVYTGDDN